MFRLLFPRLTPAEPRAKALFAAAVAEARKPFWYRDLGVPDTLDGRFSVLATVTAIATVRLERGGEAARDANVGLTERFIESMDHEHRQLGYGDPTLGKIVRRLTGVLASRIGLFRGVVEMGTDWNSGAATSLQVADAPALKGDPGEALRTFWSRLEKLGDEQLLAGRWE